MQLENREVTHTFSFRLYSCQLRYGMHTSIYMHILIERQITIQAEANRNTCIIFQGLS